MATSPFIYAIALTGGIASGKSTTASLLKLNGLQCIDADSVAHEVLQEHAQAINNLFEEEFLENGAINRAKLGELIFNDSKKRAHLEAFMHPKIRARIIEKSARFEKLKFPYLIDIPLFFETSAYDIKHVAVVYTPKAIQLKRLIERNGLSKPQALARINAQMDIEEKKRRAHFVIDNSKDLKHLQHECERFVEKIQQLTFKE